MTMQTYTCIRIGEQRSSPRVWVEGTRLALAGFAPALRYNIEVDREARRLTLRLAPDGDRLVSRKERAGELLPVIDICNGGLLAMFAGLEQLRVVFEDGAVHFMPLATEARKQERTERLREKMARGEPLACGSVSTGIGALDWALHTGMEAEGLAARMALGLDIAPEYIEQCAAKNPVWRDDTVMIAAPLQELAFDRAALARLPRLDILAAGLPCTGHSPSGRSKKKLAMGEDDPNVGHLVAGFLALVPVLNPSILLIENTPAYMSSASFSILQTQLKEWGYAVHADILHGADFNELEHRSRMVLVGVSDGIQFDFSMIQKPAPQARTLGEVLEDVAPDADCWSEMAGLKAKQERDKAAGKGFMMQIFNADSPKISTLTRGLQRNRSTDAKIAHPSNPDLLRIPLPSEHAACKSLPPVLVEGMCATKAHEGLGQSIVARPFIALGRALAVSVQSWFAGLSLAASAEEFALVA